MPYHDINSFNKYSLSKLSLDDADLLRFKLRTAARTSSQVIGIFNSPKVELFVYF
jgi:hypothetical protein